MDFKEAFKPTKIKLIISLGHVFFTLIIWGIIAFSPVCEKLCYSGLFIMFLIVFGIAFPCYWYLIISLAQITSDSVGKKQKAIKKKKTN